MLGTLRKILRRGGEGNSVGPGRAQRSNSNGRRDAHCGPSTMAATYEIGCEGTSVGPALRFLVFLKGAIDPLLKRVQAIRSDHLTIWQNYLVRGSPSGGGALGDPLMLSA
jgi:hypothetical protein